MILLVRIFVVAYFSIGWLTALNEGPWPTEVATMERLHTLLLGDNNFDMPMSLDLSAQMSKMKNLELSPNRPYKPSEFSTYPEWLSEGPVLQRLVIGGLFNVRRSCLFAVVSADAGFSFSRAHSHALRCLTPQ